MRRTRSEEGKAQEQQRGPEMGGRDGSRRIGRRGEKSTGDGCLQKWKQRVRARTSKALTYCRGNEQSARFYSTELITDS